MAVNEACQVWIEQRVQEELAEMPSNGKTVLGVAKELQLEIQKIFQAQISLPCLRSKVSRSKARCANAQLDEDQTIEGVTVEPVEPQQIKLSKEIIVEEVDRMVGSGMSIREATKVLATKSGRKKSDGIRRTYTKAKEAANTECKAQFAWQFAKVAIYQLERIPMDDLGRVRALTEVRDWINKQEGM